MMNSGVLQITTKGSKIGQINALTVQEIGGYSFGTPSRITAQTSPGNKGLINIERQVNLAGPIQHKGVLILEGFLSGTFSKDTPLSCNGFLTFEQNYGMVEGDSASAAELCAILSSLSQLPLRQDIAITGSINQFGEIQAVGGVNQKIEGFYNVCKKVGLTGEQGVLLPYSNRNNVILSQEVTDALEKGTFHIWTINHIKEAMAMLTGHPAEKIYGEIQKTLDHFRKAYEKQLPLS